MRVVFRADASSTIGSGHVMRCLTLADELSAAGANVEFICRSAPGDLTDFVAASRGHVVHRLPPETSPDADAALSAEFIAAGEPPAWLVVDQYELAASWQRQLRPFAQRLMAIDDLADRQHDCDLLLDQNLHDSGTLYDALVPPSCTKLIGPRYALLRREFAAERAGSTRRNEAVERLLVSFGGSDPTNETFKALSQLHEAHLADDLDIDCVIGASYAERDSLEALTQALPNVRLHVQTTRMARLMAEADLCVGAGGSSVWERCCLGLPTITVAVVEHQVAFCERLDRLGVLDYVGNATSEPIDYATALRRAISDHEVRHRMSRAGMELVDGRGAERVVSQMLEVA